MTFALRQVGGENRLMTCRAMIEPRLLEAGVE